MELEPTRAGQVKWTPLAGVPWLAMYALKTFLDPPPNVSLKKPGHIFLQKMDHGDDMPCVQIDEVPKDSIEPFLMKSVVRAISQFGAVQACLGMKSKLSMETPAGEIKDTGLGWILLYFEPGLKRVFFYNPEANRDDALIESTNPTEILPFICDVFDFAIPLWIVKMHSEWQSPGKSYRLEATYAD